MVALLALLGCTDIEVVEPVEMPTMADTDLLIRASLDLRGVRPSPEELALVEQDPDALAGLLDDYVYDERFGARTRDLWAEILLTRAENFRVPPETYGLSDYAVYEDAVGNEALHIISEVAENDLPFSTVLTADWTMANPTLETIWEIEREQQDAGWTRAVYTDGRPHSGVLTTNSMWWRYTTTTSNANRKRANQISRIFLCNDYLTRPIDFDRNVNLLDEGAVSDALHNDPACVNCHNSMDPIASYLFGFFTYDPDSAAEATTYHPGREQLYKTYVGMEPAFYGEPGYTLDDLGHQIAGDNRFVTCMVEHAYTGLLRRDATLADADRLTGHREAFLEGDLTWRALVRSVVDDPMYRAGDTDETGAVPLKMATPDLLASQVQGLTGFRWTYEGFDLMTTDRYGFRNLAGGADGVNVVRSATSPNTTTVLVQERLAEAAAWHAAELAAAGEATTPLFDALDWTETPETDEDAMVAQIQHLHWAIFGQRVTGDGPQVQANLELWQAIYDIEGNTVDAWAGVLAALLRDPDLLLY